MTTSPPLIEWCVRQNYGFAAGCIWILARNATEARRLGAPLAQRALPTSSPVAPIEVFPRREYPTRARPHDFTIGFHPPLFP